MNFWFSLFSILKNTKVPNQKFFFLLIEYWNATFIFNLILSTIKRKMKQSGNFAFMTMLQSVAWLSFSFFSGSVKIEFTVLVEGFIHTVNFAASIICPMVRSSSLLKGLEMKWEFRCLFMVFHDVLECLPQFCLLQRAASLWTLAKKLKRS